MSSRTRDRLAFEDHLHASPTCSREARHLRETEAASKRRAQEEPSPALLAGLKAEARKQNSRSARFK